MVPIGFGETNCNASLHWRLYYQQAFVVVNTLTADCLLGADYLVAHGIIINYKRGCVVIKDKNTFYTKEWCYYYL